MRRLKSVQAYIFGAVLTAFTLLVAPDAAEAREIKYDGQEVTVFVKPGEPTQLQFPGTIQGGFRRENSAVLLERQEKYLVVFAQPQICLLYTSDAADE